MVEIRLDQNEDEKYKLDKYVTATRKPCNESDLFFKVTHIPEDRSGITFLRFNSIKLGITWRNLNFTDSSSLVEVNVYFSNLSPDIPLILEVVTNVSKYYIARNLKSLGTNIANRQSFRSNQLFENLLNENNTQNNVITYRLDQQLSTDNKYNDITVTRNNENSFLKYTHEPYPDYKNNIAYLLFKGHLVKLQPNYQLKSNDFDTLENKKYCKLNVYYSNQHNDQPPLYLELLENKGTGGSCQSKESSASNSTWLERVDPNGYHWKQVTKPELTKEKAQEIVPQIFSNDRSSIVVQLTEKSEYPMNTIKHYEKIGIGTPINPVKEIEVSEQTLFNSTYKYYTHGFSQSTGMSNLKIERLRVFAGNIEISLFGTNTKKQTLSYNTTKDTDKMVYVYFNANDKVPLLLFYEDKWYCPSNKNEYFNKWNIATDLELKKPTDSSHNTQIIRELNKINKRLNEIDLSITQGDGYGIKRPNQVVGEYYKSSDDKFDGKLINIKPEPVSGKFGKVTHSTINNSIICKILFKDQDLKDSTGRNTLLQALTTEQPATVYTTLRAFYYKNDSDHKDPVLLGIGTNRETTVYYERYDRTNQPNTKWKKVPETESNSLRSESVLEAKINKIKYENNQSIKIQLEKNSSIDRGNYNACVIENTGLTTTSSPKGKINVTDDSSSFSGSSNYKCYRHTVNLTETNKPEICWLRFFLYNVEIHIYNSDKTYKTPVFYEQGKNDVHVYFYSGSIGDTKSNKVPLLIRYNDQSFKPVDRDNYFNKWVPHSISSISTMQTADLDAINKFLNDIELAETTNTKTGKKYGIAKPQEPPTELTSEFYDRVCLKVCFTKNYRKSTHSTTNKFGIGNILFHGNNVTGIQQSNIEANEVAVYYESCDKKFLNPLLIGVKLQGTSLINSFFYRNSADGLTWSKETGKSKYGKGSQIRKELHTIMSRLLLYFTIKVEQHRIEYRTSVSNWICNRFNTKSEDAKITVDLMGSGEDLKVTDFHIYYHRLITYYRENKEHLKPTFNQLDDNFPLCLKMTIIDRDLDLIGKNGSVVTLIYKDSVHDNRHDLELYYHQDENDPYEVPLLIKFGKNFFGPKNKDLYFSTWEILNIDTEARGDYDPKTKVKENLERIYDMVNTIEIFQTSSYGIRCCSKHQYYSSKVKKFNSKRVSLTKFTNTSGYHMYVHKTVNKTKIGSIIAHSDSYKFNEHTELVKTQSIDEVVVVFKNSNATDPPLLVLLNQTEKYSESSTYGYYYQKETRPVSNIQYEFKSTDGCKMMGILKGESQDGILGVCQDDQIENIQSVLKNINKSKMVNKSSADEDQDTTDCKEEIDNEKYLIPKCSGDDIAEQSTDADSEDSVDSNDDRPKVGSPALQRPGDGAIASGDRNRGSAQVPLVQGSPPEQSSRDPELQEQVRAVSLEQPGDIGTHGTHQQQESQVQEQHVEQQQQESQTQDSRSHLQTGHSTTTLRSPEGAGAPRSDADERGDSASMSVSGANGLAGAPGKNGEKGPVQEPPSPGTNLSASSSNHSTSSNTSQGAQQQQPNSGGGNGGAHGGGAMTHGERGAKGGSGSSSSTVGESSSSPQTGSQDGITAEKVLEIIKKPEVYASASGTAGVGVMATVGTVVYKNCVVGSRTNHSEIFSVRVTSSYIGVYNSIRYVLLLAINI